MNAQVVNRTAAVLSIKEPCLDWINSLPEGQTQTLTIESVNRDNTVYLLPEHDTDQELELITKELYPIMFKSELISICRDGSLWPEIRYETFLEWFDIKTHSMVINTCE